MQFFLSLSFILLRKAPESTAQSPEETRTLSLKPPQMKLL